jgi:hypothetical protein
VNIGRVVDAHESTRLVFQSGTRWHAVVKKLVCAQMKKRDGRRKILVREMNRDSHLVIAKRELPSGGATGVCVRST